MRRSSGVGSSTSPRCGSFGGAIALIACSTLLLAACGSSSKATSSTTGTSTQNASPTTSASTGASVTNGTSGSATLRACPTAAVVNAALGQSNTGPVVSGTSVFEICSYKGSGVIPTRVEISVGTPAEFQAGEQSVRKAGLTVVSVPGLGSEAWAPQGVGSVYVLNGSVQIEVLSPLSSPAQVQALARQLL
jgi:hypothetical protein